MIQCSDDPPILENGNVDFDSRDYGEVATYTCDSGYELVSEQNTRTCQITGEWSEEIIECELGN